MTEIPRYRCIKTVRALEVVQVDCGIPDGVELHFPEPHKPRFIDRKMTVRYEPRPGDFLVIYEDGYESISPRKAFLEGYVLEDGDDDPVRDLRERRAT